MNPSERKGRQGISLVGSGIDGLIRGRLTQGMGIETRGCQRKNGISGA